MMKLMRNLKRIIVTVIIICICSSFFCKELALAKNETLKLGAYNLNGEREFVVNVVLEELLIRGEDGGYWTEKREIPKTFDIPENVLTVAGENDNFIYMDIRTDNLDNPYPEIEPTSVNVEIPHPTESIARMIGKDYRLFYSSDINLGLEDISDRIIDDSKTIPRFNLEKLGIYILYFNPKVYNSIFYLDEPIYDDENNWVNQDCIYEQTENLLYQDIIVFPEIPKKEGFVFTGWKVRPFVGGGGGIKLKYTMPQPVKVSVSNKFYASWCPIDEYTPLQVKIESEGQIVKGNENGATITLSLSEGKFDEEINENVENDWKIIGNDELSISSVERLDDTTSKLTLSGNSSDVYTESAIQIEFNSELYISHEGFGDNWDVNEVADIQLDENGVKKAVFTSDNEVTLNAQAYSDGGGGSWRVSRYTVKFNSNGGEDIGSVRVEKNECVEEPEPPSRDGYVFKGWYSDAELTQKYDFSTEITSGLTLYAAWEEDAPKQIILTVGEKGANVFGKEIENDVAPVIKNDRVMVPIRFVAESLGAEVVWNKENPKEVKITKEDIEIVIYIGEDYAFVNGEKVKLDSSAFLENDRTYIPIRFVSERMDSDVDWEQETQKVIITLK